MFPRCNLSTVSTGFLGHSFELPILTGWNQNIAEACVVSRIFRVIALFSVVLCPVSWSFTLHKCNLILVQDSREPQNLELFLCVIVPLWYFATCIPVAPVALNLVFIGSVQWDFSCLIGLLLPAPHTQAVLLDRKSKWSFFSFLSDHSSDLPVVQCLKIVVLYILSSPIVVYSGKTTSGAFTPSG